MKYDNLQDAMTDLKKKLPPEPTVTEVFTNADTLKFFPKKFGRPNGKNPRFHNIKIIKNDMLEVGKVLLKYSDDMFEIVDLETGMVSEKFPLETSGLHVGEVDG